MSIDVNETNNLKKTFAGEALSLEQRAALIAEIKSLKGFSVQTGRGKWEQVTGNFTEAAKLVAREHKRFKGTSFKTIVAKIMEQHP